MKFLNRLSFLDLALIAALLATGIIWAVTRDRAGSISDIDFDAWAAARTAAVEAFKAGDLDAAKGALEQTAVVAEPAKDDAAAGIRSLAATLTSTDINAFSAALDALSPVPQSALFQDLYFAIWTPLFFPDFPDGPPAAGAEWVQVTAASANSTITQYWGNAVWSLPAAAAITGFEANVSVPDIGLDGTLGLDDGADGMILSFVLGDIIDGAAITDANGFWAGGADGEPLLAGSIASTDNNTIVMQLAPEARADNLDRLRNADEIVLVIEYDNGERVFLRFQVGNTGRAIIAEAFPRSGQ